MTRGLNEMSTAKPTRPTEIGGGFGGVIPTGPVCL